MSIPVSTLPQYTLNNPSNPSEGGQLTCEEGYTLYSYPIEEGTELIPVDSYEGTELFLTKHDYNKLLSIDGKTESQCLLSDSFDTPVNQENSNLHEQINENRKKPITP